MARKSPPRLHLFNATLRGIGEVESFKTPEDRQRAFDEVASEVRWYELALGVTLTTAAAVGSFMAAQAVFRYVLPRTIPAWAAEAGCYIAGIAGLALMMRALHRWGAAKELRRKLIATGVPVCLECGYRLEGLGARTETCPECGKPLDPRVTLLLDRHVPTARTDDTD